MLRISRDAQPGVDHAVAVGVREPHVVEVAEEPHRGRGVGVRAWRVGQVEELASLRVGEHDQLRTQRLEDRGQRLQPQAGPRPARRARRPVRTPRGTGARGRRRLGRRLSGLAEVRLDGGVHRCRRTCPTRRAGGGCTSGSTQRAAVARCSGSRSGQSGASRAASADSVIGSLSRTVRAADGDGVEVETGQALAARGLQHAETDGVDERPDRERVAPGVQVDGRAQGGDADHASVEQSVGEVARC